jgi:predicted NUDIX family NTP pyrophosphohydrolase
MPKRSAGLMMYRHRNRHLEVFLVHPGGPFWAKKDLGAWSIPKGEYMEGEHPSDAARREFQEETGFAAQGDFLELGAVKQPGGKVVTAWAFEGDCDPNDLTVSNLCQLEWPPRSGQLIEFPEVDRGGWFSIDEAKERILKGQKSFLDMLEAKLRLAE